GEGPRPALRLRRGAGGGPPALPPARADPRAAALHLDPDLAEGPPPQAAPGPGGVPPPRRGGSGRSRMAVEPGPVGEDGARYAPPPHRAPGARRGPPGGVPPRPGGGEDP